MERTMHARVDTHEGTTYYSDDQGRTDRRLFGYILLASTITEAGAGEVVWRYGGTTGVIAEAIARFLVMNPGMFEAVAGLYTREQKVLEMITGGKK